MRFVWHAREVFDGVVKNVAVDMVDVMTRRDCPPVCLVTCARNVTVLAVARDALKIAVPVGVKRPAGLARMSAAKLRTSRPHFYASST